MRPVPAHPRLAAAVLALGLLGPLAGVEIRNEISVDDYGATPTDGTDDSAAIQRAIDAARTLGAGIRLSAGVYVLNHPLDFTNGPTGWRIRGAGKGTTAFSAQLMESCAVMDFTGTQRLHISDFMIRAQGGRHQNIGMLFARSVANGQVRSGDQPCLENVALIFNEAASAGMVAAIVNLNADQMTMTRCDIDAPTGLVIGERPAAVSSAFGLAFAGIGPASNTRHSFHDCVVDVRRDEGIRFSAGSSLTVASTFFALLETATAAIRIVGPAGSSNSVYYYNSREEGDHGTAAATYLLDLQSGGSTGGCFEGVASIKGNGPSISIHPGITMSGYTINMQGASNLVGGGGNLESSVIWNNWAYGLQLGANPASNLIIGQ